MATGNTEITHERRKPAGPLRRGWTTGACATAATETALTALPTGEFPDPVPVVLPKGETPAFALAREAEGEDFGEAGIVEDAGDDPDVTHGATIIVRATRISSGTGIVFRAGDGVSAATRPDPPVLPAEPAITPAPRAMMTRAFGAAALNRFLKERALSAKTAQQALDPARQKCLELAPGPAGLARGAPAAAKVTVTGRKGEILARTGFA